MRKLNCDRREHVFPSVAAALGVASCSFDISSRCCFFWRQKNGVIFPIIYRHCGDPFESRGHARDAFGFERFDEALGKIGRMGVRIFHIFIVGTKLVAKFV